MTDMPMSSMAADRGFPRVALGVLWVLAALAAGVPGWLLIALSELTGNRVAGALLLAAAALGAGTAAVLLRGRAARTLSLVASGVVIVAGVAVGVIVSAGGPFFAADLLLVSGFPLLAGAVTVVLALRR